MSEGVSLSMTLVNGEPHLTQCPSDQLYFMISDDQGFFLKAGPRCDRDGDEYITSVHLSSSAIEDPGDRFLFKVEHLQNSDFKFEGKKCRRAIFNGRPTDTAGDGFVLTNKGPLVNAFEYEYELIEVVDEETRIAREMEEAERRENKSTRSK
eukprot:CAMPEP_0194697644 /NCGR_PEP_ID=MMETSP0295-20121207/23556_1 /TAXON_ID=39354 /ORGANISM="Heterosigma akashiwo, Strain CCMP2393" /LENGTH=151 /DNA_ID=CAMNT_0039590369 /DNA_START=237 /DNA_END=693 /DNA_ORIENTATION=-